MIDIAPFLCYTSIYRTKAGCLKRYTIPNQKMGDRFIYEKQVTKDIDMFNYDYFLYSDNCNFC